MSEGVIVAEGLTRVFGTTRAVDEMTLEIGAGEIFGFLGHNGAGKTTTVRLLNGVLAPSGGSVRVLGFDPQTQGAQVRARTGVLTESPALDDRLTARATLSFFGEIYGLPKQRRDERADELLELFDLSKRANDKVGGFSKGMKQRMALARTIVHSPEILFLDEPTAALDPVATREVHALIRNASQREGRTVFLCTHNLYEAERLCTRVAVLARGKILAIGEPAELATQYGSRQRMLIEVGEGEVERAMARISALPGAPQVFAANGQNGSAHPVSGNGHIFEVQGVAHSATPMLVSALVGAGISVFQVIPEQATLEDVYFALQGGENIDA